MNTLVLISVILISLILIISMYYYNSFIKNKNKVKNAWSDIDVYLKKRYDVIPNLVETVKGYANQEKEVLENIVKYRNQTQTNNASKEDRVASEMKLSGALQSMFAVVENYPDLKSNQNFLALQNSLSEIENDIEDSRRYYNAVVRDYNNTIELFPGLLFAKLFNFSSENSFEVAQNEKENVKISFK